MADHPVHTSSVVRTFDGHRLTDLALKENHHMKSPTIRQCGLHISCEGGRVSSVPKKQRVAAWVCEVSGTGSFAETACRSQEKLQPVSSELASNQQSAMSHFLLGGLHADSPRQPSGRQAATRQSLEIDAEV